MVDTRIIAACDPMASILPLKWYLIWVEMHHPHVPSLDTIGKLVSQMSADERKLVVAQAKSVKTLCKAVEEGAAKVE